MIEMIAQPRAGSSCTSCLRLWIPGPYVHAVRQTVVYGILQYELHRMHACYHSGGSWSVTLSNNASHRTARLAMESSSCEQLEFQSKATIHCIAGLCYSVQGIGVSY